MVKLKKVLHIGNVANNAYLNSKILNTNNNFISSDVISFNYSHIMSLPIWEDGEMNEYFGSQNNPYFKKNTFKNPNWFISGSLIECIIRAKARRHKKKYIRIIFSFINYIFKNLHIYGFLRIKILSFFFKKLLRLRVNKQSKKSINNTVSVNDYKNEYIISNLLKSVFECYDLIIAYGTMPNYVYLSKTKTKDIAYEHGTLRSIPLENSSLGKLTKLSYQNASYVFITNPDVINSVTKLNLKNFSFIPHPINESFESNKANMSINMTKQYFKIFHPTRHHWSDEKDPNNEKSNDVLIYAIKDLITTHPEINLEVCFIEWGKHVSKSKKLIDELKISKYIDWKKPLPYKPYMQEMMNSHVVVDQFFIGSLGSISTKALAYGKILISFYETKKNSWALPNQPPIINVNNQVDLKQHLSDIYSNSNDKLLEINASKYFNNHLSSAKINSILEKRINKLL